MSLRVDVSEFRSHPWRIHDIAPDFEVEDVWQLPDTPPISAFPDAVQYVASFDPATTPLPVRFLWEARWTLGQWFGWDDEGDGIGARVESLRERLPRDLRSQIRRPDLFTHLPFTVLYALENEFAAEIANKTVHGVMHMGAIPIEGDRSRIQMTVLVKPNGWFGRAYMLGIKPFRYAIYPTMIDLMSRGWRNRMAAAS